MVNVKQVGPLTRLGLRDRDRHGAFVPEQD